MVVVRSTVYCVGATHRCNGRCVLCYIATLLQCQHLLEERERETSHSDERTCSLSYCREDNKQHILHDKSYHNSVLISKTSTEKNIGYNRSIPCLFYMCCTAGRLLIGFRICDKYSWPQNGTFRSMARVTEGTRLNYWLKS
jgi:hypothetical protein